jgi:hypothetical protein
MYAEDAAKILAKASLFDARTIGAAEAQAWAEALSIADPPITVSDALVAVTRWYAEHEIGRIGPAGVIRGAHEIALDRRRNRRDQARDAALNRAIESRAVEALGTRDRSAEVNALVADLRRRIGPLARPEAMRRPEWVRADQRREAAATRRRIDPTGLGWCVACHRDGRLVLAEDPDTGSACREHSQDAPRASQD